MRRPRRDQTEHAQVRFTSRAGLLAEAGLRRHLPLGGQVIVKKSIRIKSPKQGVGRCPQIAAQMFVQRAGKPFHRAVVQAVQERLGGFRVSHSQVRGQQGFAHVTGRHQPVDLFVVAHRVFMLSVQPRAFGQLHLGFKPFCGCAE
jgi:hypothetical protein